MPSSRRVVVGTYYYTVDTKIISCHGHCRLKFLNSDTSRR